MFTSVTNEAKWLSARVIDHLPEIWSDEILLPFVGRSPVPPVCNHAFSTPPFFFPWDHTDETLAGKDGKINDYNEIFAFLQGRKNNEQEMCHPQLFGGAKSLQTAPAGESGWEARGVSGWLEKCQVTRTTFFFFMLHGPTEAQPKRQITGAISYGGEICQPLSLFLHKGWTGLEISWAADKRMQSDICQSIHLPMVWWSLFLMIWGLSHVGCTRYPTGCFLPTGNSFGRDPSLLET